MVEVQKAKEEMLSKKKWAVIGVTPDENKFAYKIFKKLKANGYTAYAINPKYQEVDGDKVYSSIHDLPEEVDCVNIVVNPNISMSALDQINEKSIKYVWFQPGTFDSQVIKKATDMGMNIVYYDCLLVELGRVNKVPQ